MPKILLITRPQGDLGLKYLEHWSEKIIDAAKNKGALVLDLKHKRAARKELESVIRKKSPHIIIFNGHGDYDLLTGQFQEPLVIATENVQILAGSIVYAVSCRSAKILGEQAVLKSAKAYIGYKENFIFHYNESSVYKPLLDEKAKLFLEPSNQVAISLLKGRTTQESFVSSQKFWIRNLQKLLVKQYEPGNTALISSVYHNFKHQVCLGNGNAVM